MLRSPIEAVLFHNRLNLGDATYAIGDQFGGEAIDLPADAELSLSFVWGDEDMFREIERLCRVMRLPEIASKMAEGQRPDVDICTVTKNDILSYAQRICDAGEPVATCVQRAEHASVAGFPPEEARLDVAFDMPELPLMRELLLRFSDAREHAPLPDSQEIREMREAFVRDYALLLDHPMAAQDRLDMAKLRPALQRQPQLYRYYRGRVEKRIEVWDLFVQNMAMAGFDMGDLAPFPAPD